MAKGVASPTFFLETRVKIGYHCELNVTQNRYQIGKTTNNRI